MFYRAIKRIHRLFIQQNVNLAVAESCTSGFIGHLITLLPGASRFFIGGIIAYSIESKRKILEIAEETIKRYGVVSAETAMEMAENVRLLMNADYAVSTTGNLGPGVLENKEIGIVYFGLSKKRKLVSKMKKFEGNRNENKISAALYALNILGDFLEENEMFYCN